MEYELTYVCLCALVAPPGKMEVVPGCGNTAEAESWMCIPARMLYSWITEKA